MINIKFKLYEIEDVLKSLKCSTSINELLNTLQEIINTLHLFQKELSYDLEWKGFVIVDFQNKNLYSNDENDRCIYCIKFYSKKMKRNGYMLITRKYLNEGNMGSYPIAVYSDEDNFNVIFKYNDNVIEYLDPICLKQVIENISKHNFSNIYEQLIKFKLIQKVGD